MAGLDETYLAWESTCYPDGGKYEGLMKVRPCRRARRLQPRAVDKEHCGRVWGWLSRVRYRALKNIATLLCFASQDGQCHGKGVFQYADGDRFEGEYFEGQMDGMGVYRWSNGRRGAMYKSFAPCVS